jgi:hypothetical protein
MQVLSGSRWYAELNALVIPYFFKNNQRLAGGDPN